MSTNVKYSSQTHKYLPILEYKEVLVSALEYNSSHLMASQ